MSLLPVNCCRALLLAVFMLAIPGATSAPSAGMSPTELESAVAQLLARMTLAEKVGQMMQAEIRHVTPEEVGKYCLGSILNGGGSFPAAEKSATVDDWLSLADAYHEASMRCRLQIPVLWGTDAVHGHNNVMGATLFPHNIALGAAHDPALVQRIGEATAREVAVTGIDWAFAPTVALVQDARWGRTYEGYSADPALVADYAKAMVLGLQGNPQQGLLADGRVLATAKHFIGDGATRRGIDQGDVTLPEKALLEIHGAGYRSAIAAGVQTVMASFNSWQGAKVHGSHYLLTEVLKERWGFDGLIVSDWNGVGQVAGCNNESCPRAIEAGIDMIMVPEDWRALLQNTVTQVEEGVIPVARIDDAVSRILRVKARAGLFDGRPPSARAFAGETRWLGHPEHRALAREAVRKSLVLLKNDGGLLPLQVRDRRVLVAGRAADDIGQQNGGWTLSWQGTGNTNADFPGATSIYQGLRQAVTDAGGTIELSVDGKYRDPPDLAIVVFGEQPYAEGQGDLRSLDYFNDGEDHLALMRDLRARGIPVVAVFLTGRPLWINPELNAADAFVVAWLPGSEGAGVADVVVAAADGATRHAFTGRLPFGWPATESNPEDAASPVSALLFEAGYGLDSKAVTDMAQRFSEEMVGSVEISEQVIFDGRSRAPWRLFVGDSSDWQREVDSPVMRSAFGQLEVTSVDRQVQEDARRMEWHGGRLSQVYWLAEETSDFTELARSDGFLVMSLMVDRLPEGEVELRMDCGYPCSGALAVGDALRRLPEGQWVDVAVELDCFARAGADLSQVNAPVVFVAREPVTFTVSDIRLTTHGSGYELLSCDPAVNAAEQD